MGRNNKRQWRGGHRGRGNAGGRNNGQDKRKEKEIKFSTQGQMQRGYYATYTIVVIDAIVADVQKKYKFGTDVAKVTL